MALKRSVYGKLFAMATALLLLLCACATPVGVQNPDERAFSDAQRIYRDSSLVVSGTCLQMHTDADGNNCYDLKVEEVIAGNASLGDIIHITDGSMKTGESYLLYLDLGEDAYYTEDSYGYTLVSDGALHISDGNVTMGNTKVSLSELKRNISSMKSVITMPYLSYYYSTLNELALAVDEIFIGEVVRMPAMADYSFRANADGTSMENTMPASIVRIRVFGSSTGIHNYGDTISMIYAPAMSANVMDAATLQPRSFSEKQVPSLQVGDIYIFFLIKGPDAKQDYYFPVNPMQGYTALEGNSVRSTYVNTALSSYRDLDALITDIRSTLD